MKTSDTGGECERDTRSTERDGEFVPTISRPTYLSQDQAPGSGSLPQYDAIRCDAKNDRRKKTEGDPDPVNAPKKQPTNKSSAPYPGPVCDAMRTKTHTTASETPDLLNASKSKKRFNSQRIRKGGRERQTTASASASCMMHDACTAVSMMRVYARLNRTHHTHTQWALDRSAMGKVWIETLVSMTFKPKFTTRSS